VGDSAVNLFGCSGSRDERTKCPCQANICAFSEYCPRDIDQMQLLLLCGCPARGISVQSPSTQERVPAGLKEAVDKFMAILEKGQPDGLFGLASSEGVVFGIESDPMPVSRVRDELRKKEGIYCLLFDTDCLRKETLQEGSERILRGTLELLSAFEKRSALLRRKKFMLTAPAGRAGFPGTSN